MGSGPDCKEGRQQHQETAGKLHAGAANYANDFTIYRIALKNAPKFNVSYDHGDGFTVWGIKIDTPMRVAEKRTALNTDGIDPGEGSKNITITHSYIRNGEDNVAITGGVMNVTVSHNHFYWGHGMSIGSLVTKAGVSKIRVYDLTIDGAENGIRIKSSSTRGGLVHDVAYDDVCIRNSRNPIKSSWPAGGELVSGVPRYHIAQCTHFRRRQDIVQRLFR